MKDNNLKRKTVKGLYWTSLSKFSDYGIQFVIGIVMARLLSPDDYGIAALPAVFISVAGVFIDSGFANAMIRKPELKEKDLSTAFYYSIFVGIVCYLIIYFSSPFIASFYNTPVLENLMRVTALNFLIGPLSTPQYILLKRNLDFKTPTIISFVSKIIMGLVGIIIAYSGYGVWALILSNLVSSVLNLILCWSVVKWKPQTGWSSESFQYLWNYGNKLLASSLIDKLYTNIIPIFVGKFYSTLDLGIYNRAAHYASLPSQQITGVVQSVTFPVLSKLQNDDDALERNYRRMIRTTAFILFPIMLLLSALARPIIIVLITEKWEKSIILLQLMCFSMMWYPVHAMNLNLLQVKGRTDLFLRLEIIKKSYGLIALAITLPISLIAVVLGRWVTNILSLFVNTYYTNKLIGVSFIMQMKDLLPSLALSMFMFLIVHIVNYFVIGYIYQIIIGTTVGVSIYIGIAYLLKFKEIKDIKVLLNKY
jgi:O-antigen/teichoic acid export membrane protein